MHFPFRLIYRLSGLAMILTAFLYLRPAESTDWLTRESRGIVNPLSVCIILLICGGFVFAKRLPVFWFIVLHVPIVFILGANGTYVALSNNRPPFPPVWYFFGIISLGIIKAFEIVPNAFARFSKP